MKPLFPNTDAAEWRLAHAEPLPSTDRRQFLKALGGLGLAGVAPGLSLAAVKSTASGKEPDIAIELRAAPDEIAIRPGQPTKVWRFHARVLKGNPNAVENLPGTYAGPVIRVDRGQRVRILFINELPQPSIVHWHGLVIPEAMDGHPRYAVPPGARYEYEFTVQNRAGTYWFHPHPHELTGPQVYAGLAGLFIVSDSEERALGLPSGEQDVALVIQDRSFSPDNQLLYLGNAGGMMGMMTGMMGFTGDHILVNGRSEFAFSAERRPYRLRLLNGSNSRIYKLAWQDGSPMTVIGSDGGLLAAPMRKPYITLAPAERVELWVDCSERMPGDRISLVSLPFAGGAGGPMMGRMGASRLPNGSPFPVLDIKVRSSAKATGKLPIRLASISPIDTRQAVNRENPRNIRITASGMVWGLNGRLFRMEEVAEDEIVRLGSTEIWEFVNEASMGMMGGMPHPLHVHGVQFRVVGRRIHPSMLESWGSVSRGYVDDGWKDTVLLMPGERIRVQMRFDGHPGLFLYHCHNLEHEDMGMMRNFRIKA